MFIPLFPLKTSLNGNLPALAATFKWQQVCALVEWFQKI